MGEAGISPRCKKVVRRRMKGMKEGSLFILIIREMSKKNFMKVLHGLKKDPELRGSHILVFSETGHFLLFMLEIPCAFKYFSNNKSIRYPYRSSENSHNPKSVLILMLTSVDNPTKDTINLYLSLSMIRGYYVVTCHSKSKTARRPLNMSFN